MKFPKDYEPEVKVYLLIMGGIAFVSEATDIPRKTTEKTMKEIQGASYTTDRIRKKGGDRKYITLNRPEIKEKLMELVKPSIQGDSQSPML
ncbi:MAG: hypothetical protein QXU18_05850 [Thermoplasmatales archaeon]